MGSLASQTVSAERFASRHYFVKQCTEREDVGARVHRFALELFGRHVLQRAQNR